MTGMQDTTLSGHKPSLLLHICCGPCATVAIERLRDSYAVTGYFFNPNVYPEDEYFRRREAAEKVAAMMQVPFIEGAYEPMAFFDAVRGLEDVPENSDRCTLCYRLRLNATARYAAENGFDTIASTLTTGPQKKAAVIDPVGEAAAEAAGVRFVAGDWKKQDGFRRSCELSREFGLYRQNYCGCRFSMPRLPG